MLERENVKQWVQKYFTEANNEQVEILLEELAREIEVMTHVKIRELVSLERNKKHNKTIGGSSF